MNGCCKKSFWLILLIVMCCIAMAVIETVVEPAYFVKSLLKIVVFLIVPIVPLINGDLLLASLSQ